MYKHLYSRFLNTNPNRLHFAAHSHHLWPDVSRDAHISYWDDAATYIDDKWDKIFNEVIPTAQNHIASILQLSDPKQIAFAPNTCEFVNRLISCFASGKKMTILTTDGEFHSFRRISERLQELSHVEVIRIPVDPFSSFEARFLEEAQRRVFDLIFVSHVFFNSGYAIKDLTRFVTGLGASHNTIVIDGYHGFCAIPTDLKKIESKIFYMGGGYKYAQSGEGVCFMHVPEGSDARPLNTGWFAAYGTLKSKPKDGEVPYSDDGFRFWGATFDPSGMYRFNAVMKMFQDQSLTILGMHQYIQKLQEYFLKKLAEKNHPALNKTTLLKMSSGEHGHFLTFETPMAQALYNELHAKEIITDVRGDRLRFGFGIYLTEGDIDALFERF